ncbi:MAG: hypothetical protein M1470_13970 [Bacteroidetes bacterium]|nr:hypothetical protein [Bacteroidota bacterium]
MKVTSRRTKLLIPDKKEKAWSRFENVSAARPPSIGVRQFPNFKVHDLRALYKN